MYERRYGLLRTLAPLHVGASAGEESGNLNLIFRDPFTQTGIIPGSSIRGRFRAEMRQGKGDYEFWYGKSAGEKEISEGLVKFEYASLLWLPVFCPGQPVVWVSCPRLLRRYAATANPALLASVPEPYSCSETLKGRSDQEERTLFFNLGFMTVKPTPGLQQWVPEPLKADVPADRLVVVSDADIGMIHDMALYRQSRVKLSDTMKKVDGGAFFNVEALPEGSVLVVPMALKPDRTQTWQPFDGSPSQDLYFGGLESVGFGRCSVTLMSCAAAKTAAEVA